ncbi:MAG: signal peptidase [Chryseobacterium sp.]|uniref:signal peptidase n=1 Tax=Chryseobacterium sp. TaxID=1871047 RepID=UPI0025BAB4D6|nr:signal peptidase [Chryseobacterium sp.]MCJ7934630.1 signal peptidase [Chryseobacterium sp.]
MKTISKLISAALFLFAVLLVKADDIPPPPGGGTGGVGPGSAASPIDMYVYVLSAVAITFIVIFTKKYKSQKA